MQVPRDEFYERGFVCVTDDRFMEERMKRTATISSDGRYRYDLTRSWSEGRPRVCWAMLNPSTADGTEDDPTIRRCVGFSKAWGFGSLVVVNLWALRATNPRELLSHPDPCGLENERFVAQHVAYSGVTVAAWGAFQVKGRTPLRIPGQLHCLGVTKAGAPKHPLYIAGDTPLQVFSQ